MTRKAKSLLPDPGDELVQIVDRDNRETEVVPRRIMRARRLIHRATYILVFGSNQELFIQKRTLTKDIYPGFWDCAAGGVVLAGEDYLSSARRELQEELGLAGIELTHRFDQYFEDAANRVWGRIFTCTSDGPFHLQAEEVAYGRFLPLAEIPALHAAEPFTPDSLLLLETLARLRPDYPSPDASF